MKNLGWLANYQEVMAKKKRLQYAIIRYLLILME